MGTGIFLELTEEQLVYVEAQAKDEGAPPPEEKTDMMVIPFEDIWLQPYSEDVVQYPNADIKVTSSEGIAIAVQMPDKLKGGHDFRITDVQIPETPHGREVCWSTTPDFDNPISSGSGGTSAWAAIPIEPDMAGKMYYFCSRLSTGTIPSSYESMFTGLNR